MHNHILNFDMFYHFVKAIPHIYGIERYQRRNEICRLYNRLLLVREKCV